MSKGVPQPTLNFHSPMRYVGNHLDPIFFDSYEYVLSFQELQEVFANCAPDPTVMVNNNVVLLS